MRSNIEEQHHQISMLNGFFLFLCLIILFILRFSEKKNKRQRLNSVFINTVRINIIVQSNMKQESNFPLY